MDKQKQVQVSPPPVGGASLLVVFAVLCLTVFALLSLSTVRANERLSEASARRRTTMRRTARPRRWKRARLISLSLPAARCA